MGNANNRSSSSQSGVFEAPPSLADIEVMAERAFASIPVELRQMTDTILFRVEDFPDEEICRDMELQSPFDLLGLYQGVDLTQKSFADPSPDPDVVFLYRRPILDYWCETGEDLEHLVRHVLIHEIGHHFGLSDDDMEALEASVAEG
ncbi:metallopeptidase family protein [Hwanghaeella sp.]|uniref:metallopeptidase family protein n=1 Tax=Hwanghaeella sp. TaxID=2605943 RepID=UPI003CCB769B